MEKLANKYVNMGKEWLVGEYGEWENKTTEIGIDDDEMELVNDLIEAIYEHEDVYSCKKTTSCGLVCVKIEFLG